MIKKIFMILFFISFFSVANASEFCNGFKNGFITGYKSAKNTGMNPMVPFCPMKPMKGFGDPQSDYEHGYIVGFKQGQRS